MQRPRPEAPGSPPPSATGKFQTRPLWGTSQICTENVILKVLGMVTSGVPVRALPRTSSRRVSAW
jgi:hypothetical protein